VLLTATGTGVVALVLLVASVIGHRMRPAALDVVAVRED
jgi:hypothetical protein